jgi:hypothetical protein
MRTSEIAVASQSNQALIPNMCRFVSRQRPGLQFGLHLRNAEIKAARAGRVSDQRESGSPAIGAQSAASRSNCIGDKVVRHVSVLDGDVPTILLKAPMSGLGCAGWGPKGYCKGN